MDRIVLFGGSTSEGPANDTWVFDPTSLTWVETVSSIRPSARTGHAMAYHAASGLIVLFGGADHTNRSVPEGLYNDTWVYNLSAAAWKQLAPTGSPSPREDAAMVYDEASGRMILLGGWTADRDSNETWAYDLAADAWTRLSRAEGFRPARVGNAMAYHAASAQVVALDGIGRTWAYNSALDAWTKRGSVESTAGVRLWTSLVDDRRDERIVLFGGSSLGHLDTFIGPPSLLLYDDTWAYDVSLDQWREMRPAENPGGRSGHSMVYHAPTGKVVLFGGMVADCPYFNDEMWVYDLAWNAWTLVGPSPLASPPLMIGALSSNGSVVVLWDPPRLQGASPVSGYRLYWIESSRQESSPLSEWTRIEVGDVGSYTVTGLTTGVDYTFKVTAMNRDGEGPSSCLAFETPQAVPDLPSSPPMSLPAYVLPMGAVAVVIFAVLALRWQRRKGRGGRKEGV